MRFGRRGKRVWRGGKNGLRRVADRLEEGAPVALDRLPEEGEVLVHGPLHRRPIALPAAGAPFNVSEEEADGTPRQVGPGRSPTVQSTETPSALSWAWSLSGTTPRSASVPCAGREEFLLRRVVTQIPRTHDCPSRSDSQAWKTRPGDRLDQPKTPSAVRRGMRACPIAFTSARPGCRHRHEQSC